MRFKSRRSAVKAAAQAAFRALQAKYPNQLSGRQAIIRRADLGAAGIYYRALVGPFCVGGKGRKVVQRTKGCRRRLHYPEKIDIRVCALRVPASRPARQGYSDGSNNSALLARRCSRGYAPYRFDAPAASTVQSGASGESQFILY